jgi:hypothetical protein
MHGAFVDYRDRIDMTDVMIHMSERLLALLEIVDALDRRIPPMERAGETGIATDAARLRESAAERIAHLRGQGAETIP